MQGGQRRALRAPGPPSSHAIVFGMVGTLPPSPLGYGGQVALPIPTTGSQYSPPVPGRISVRSASAEIAAERPSLSATPITE